MKTRGIIAPDYLTQISLIIITANAAFFMVLFYVSVAAGKMIWM